VDPNLEYKMRGLVQCWYSVLVTWKSMLLHAARAYLFLIIRRSVVQFCIRRSSDVAYSGLTSQGVRSIRPEGLRSSMISAVKILEMFLVRRTLVV
jgi:hypothetical protein